jgi:DUF4097 and DUF4098 domain-containing protein YvlB
LEEIHNTAFTRTDATIPPFPASKETMSKPRTDMEGAFEMLQRVAFGVMWTIVLGAAVIASADQPYQETFDQSYPAEAGVRVSLENVNGDVSVAVWDRAEVRVEAVKEASSSDLLSKIEIDVDASPGSIDIETDLPSHRGSGRMSVEYTLTVPRSASTELELVNGSLRLSGVEGGVEAECVNGSILATELAGSVSIESVNGATEVTLAATRPNDRISLESVNGAIDLRLAPGTGAELDAETINGRISNDLGIEVRKGQWVGSSMRGTVGVGGAEISIETVNGAITVTSQ